MSDAVKEAALRELERRIGTAAHAAKEVLAYISPVSPLYLPLYLAYISTLAKQVVAKALMSKLQPRVHRLSNPYRNRIPTPNHDPNTLSRIRSRTRTLRPARRVQRLSDAKTAGMLHCPN